MIGIFDPLVNQLTCTSISNLSDTRIGDIALLKLDPYSMTTGRRLESHEAQAIRLPRHGYSADEER